MTMVNYLKSELPRLWKRQSVYGSERIFHEKGTYLEAREKYRLTRYLVTRIERIARHTPVERCVGIICYCVFRKKRLNKRRLFDETI